MEHHRPGPFHSTASSKFSDADRGFPGVSQSGATMTSSLTTCSQFEIVPPTQKERELEKICHSLQKQVIVLHVCTN